MTEATKGTATIGFSADEVITILMALDAAVFLASTIGKKDEATKAADLRDKLIKSLSAQLAMKLNEKDATRATVN